jgi:transposase, IS5 family
MLSTDTTVQEKNITYPTDNKLHRKIIKKCIAIADMEGIDLRQRYTRTVKKLLLVQRFRNHEHLYKDAFRHFYTHVLHHPKLAVT